MMYTAPMILDADYNAVCSCACLCAAVFGLGTGSMQ